MSGDPEQEYFADGVIEEIITALSRFKWLFVTLAIQALPSRAAPSTSRKSDAGLACATFLRVPCARHLGKFASQGRLIDAVTGTHIWADRFERDLNDVFALQDEVTVAVVSAIQPKLLQTEIAMAARQRPENLTAYVSARHAVSQSVYPRRGWPRRLGWLIALWSWTLGSDLSLLWQVPVT